MKSFGETLRVVLIKKGMRCVELSQLSGLNQPYLSRLLNGKQKDPTFAKGCAICDALGMTTDEFVSLQKRLEEEDE